MSIYNTNDFNSNTPFIPLKCCGDVTVDFDVESLKDTIAESINDSVNSKLEKIDSTIEKLDDTIEGLDNNIEELATKIDKTNHHIHHATDKIIDEIDAIDPNVCLCNVATKSDIENVINKINEHTDNKFDEIDFLSQFENLNNQLKEIKND